MNNINLYFQQWFLNLGIGKENVDILSRITIIAAIIVVIAVTYVFSKRILVRTVKRIIQRTTSRWDDHLFDDKVLNSICHLIPPIAFYVLTPLAFGDLPVWTDGLRRACLIFVVIVILQFISAFISALYRISCEKANVEQHPLKGIYQMLKLICIILGIIIIISLLVDKSPVVILAGMGAVAAALTFVFQDTILGFVAGVQLSANNMLKPGDWIAAPKYGADGVVIDVTLNTVKVRNWDMTITTVPPYALIKDSFQNWRGMFDSGGRRVKRSINIDINSIHFCTPEQLTVFKNNGWLNDFDSKSDKIVNLHVFRNYLERYLSTNSQINQDMLQIVRQLQPTPQGLPLELYFFTASTQWVQYEKIQATIFEHVYAILPEFGLKAFQSPTGTDLQHLH